MEPAFALSLVVFLPTLVALALAVFPKGSDELIKLVTLIATVATLALTVWLVLMPFDVEVGSMQQAFSLRWIPSFDIDYFMGD